MDPHVGNGARGYPLVLVRLALIRLRRRWTAALAVGLGLAATVALSSSITLVQSIASEFGLQALLRNLGDQAFVVVGLRGIPDETAYVGFQDTATADVKRSLGPLLVPQARFAMTEEFSVDSRNGAREARSAEWRLAFREGLEEHVEVLAGHFPSEARSGNAWWATVTEAAAAGQGLRPDDQLCMSVVNHPQESWCARIAAVWRPKDPAEAFWRPDGVPKNALLIGRPQFFDVLRTLPDAGVSGRAVFEPNRSAIRQSGAPAIYDGLQRLRGLYNVRRTDAFVSTGLDSAIAGLLNRLRVAQFPMQLLSAQVILLALFYVAFVTGHVLGQQGHLFGVWRSRGWNRDGIWSLLVLEFGILAFLAIPVGLAIAWVAAFGTGRLIYGGFPVRTTIDIAQVWPRIAGILAIALGVLAVQAFSAAGGQGVLDIQRQASRPVTRPFWQRRFVDLGLAALSIPLLAEVRLLGQGTIRAQGVEATDPLSLLLPGIAFTLVVLALLRLLPAIAVVAGRIWSDLAGSMASWQLSRNPVQHARLALLLSLAIALGVFASTYLTTAPGNAADRVAYAAGADILAVVRGDRGKPPVEEVTGALKGVEASSFAFRGSGRAGTSRFEPKVLAVDPYSFQRVAWFRRDLAREPLPRLIQRLVEREKGGLLLPGRPDRIGLWVYSTRLKGELTIGLTDAAGKRCDCSLGPLDFTGWRYLEAPLVFPGGAPQYPLRLRGLSVRPATGNAGLEAQGMVGLSDLGVRAAGTNRPNIVESFSAPEGWWRTAPDTGLSQGDVSATTSLQRDGRPVVMLPVDTTLGTVVVRPLPSTDPVPALAPSPTLRRLGIKVDETFPLKVGGVTVPIVVVGQADHFPTFYAETEDFLVVAGDPFLAMLGQQGFDRAWPNEAWLKVNASADAADVSNLRSRPEVSEVRDRRSMEVSARQDTVMLALEANLAIGAAAVLILGLIAFVLHFLVTARGRLSQYAILQANGISDAVIQRSLRIEQLVLLAFTVVVGCAAGLVFSWFILPPLQLGTEILETVPPTVVMVDARLLAGTLAGVAGLALLVGLLVTRLGRRVRLMDELRMLG